MLLPPSLFKNSMEEKPDLHEFHLSRLVQELDSEHV